ncbi:MAG: hypothetical protein D6728_05460 [Cyanobacteria bacterium J055]|nr:MAG: hypothetical protein D6728_05460 [Cyanobacteria bacterium J055]
MSRQEPFLIPPILPPIQLSTLVVSTAEPIIDSNGELALQEVSPVCCNLMGAIYSEQNQSNRLKSVKFSIKMGRSNL